MAYGENVYGESAYGENSGSSGPSGTLAAVLPRLTANLSGSYTGSAPTPIDGTLDGILPRLTAALTGTYTGPVPTDTSNAFDGRTREAQATVTITSPVAPRPTGRTFGSRVDKAVALRDPIMVGGRPT